MTNASSHFSHGPVVSGAGWATWLQGHFTHNSDGGDFWALIGGDPTGCKSNRLHVDILRFFFIKLECIQKARSHHA